MPGGPHHDQERQRRKLNHQRILDFEHEQVFEGYDPLCDDSPGYDAEFHGFAFPMPDPDLDPNCTCTVDPAEPATASLCDYCLYRLTAEAA